MFVVQPRAASMSASERVITALRIWPPKVDSYLSKARALHITRRKKGLERSGQCRARSPVAAHPVNAAARRCRARADEDAWIGRRVRVEPEERPHEKLREHVGSAGDV